MADFWTQERTNRRQTVMLVAVFLTLYCALGLGLDFLIGALRFSNGSLRGFPIVTLAALAIGLIQAAASILRRSGIDSGFSACETAAAR